MVFLYKLFSLLKENLAMVLLLTQHFLIVQGLTRKYEGNLVVVFFTTNFGFSLHRLSMGYIN